MSANAGEWISSLDKAGSALDKFSERLGKTFSISQIAQGVTLGNILSSIIGKIGDAISSAFSRADEIKKLSESLGVPIERMSELAYAAQRTGVGTDALSGSLKTLATNLQSVAAGDKTGLATRSLEAMGVAALDSAGKVRPIKDVLDDLIKKFASYSDGASKTALATAIFGKSGADLLPLLDKGADGMAKFAEKAKELGLVVDEKAAKAAQDFTGNVHTLTETFEGLFSDAVQPLIQGLDDLWTKFKEGLAATGIKLIPVMKDLAGVITAVAEKLKTLLPTSDEVATAFARIEEAAISSANRIRNFGIEVGAVFQAVIARFKLDFTGADKIIADAHRQVLVNTRDTNEQIADLYRNLGKNAKDTASTIVKVNAPVPRSIKSITDAERELNRSIEAGKAYAEKLFTPYQQLEKVLKNLDDAYHANKISAEQLGVAQQAAAYAAASAYAGVFSQLTSGFAQLFSKNKAVAIANALVNTFEAVTKALAAYPPPLSYVAAAGALAAGLAQVANIRRTTHTGGGGGGSSASAGSAAPALTQAPQRLIVEGINPRSLYSGEAVKGLAQELVAFQKDGGQVTIR